MNSTCSCVRKYTKYFYLSWIVSNMDNIVRFLSIKLANFFAATFSICIETVDLATD